MEGLIYDTDDGEGEGGDLLIENCRQTRSLPLAISLNVWAAVSNLFVIAVLSSRTSSLRRTFGCVMLSLAISDLSVATFVIPMAIYNYYRCSVWELGFTVCGSWKIVAAIMCAASITHHCCIAVSRYLAISRPHENNWLKLAAKDGILYRIIFPSWLAATLIGTLFSIYCYFFPEAIVKKVGPDKVSCQLRGPFLVIGLSSMALIVLIIIAAATILSICRLRHRLENRERNSERSNRPSASTPISHTPPVLVLTPPANNGGGTDLPRKNRLLKQFRLLMPCCCKEKKPTLTKCRLTLPKIVDYYLQEDDYFGTITPRSLSATFFNNNAKTSSRSSVGSVTDLDTDEISTDTVTNNTSCSGGIVRLSVPQISLQKPASPTRLSVPRQGQDTGSIVMEAIKEDDEPDCGIICSPPVVTVAVSTRNGKRLVKQSPTIESYTSMAAQDFDESVQLEFEQMRKDVALCENDDENLSLFSTSSTSSEVGDKLAEVNGTKSTHLTNSTTTSTTRKRAFSVDLPLSFLYFQQAPLAHFEVHSKKNLNSSIFIENNSESSSVINISNNIITNSISSSLANNGRNRFHTQPETVLLNKLRQLKYRTNHENCDEKNDNELKKFGQGRSPSVPRRNPKIKERASSVPAGEGDCNLYEIDPISHRYYAPEIRPAISSTPLQTGHVTDFSIDDEISEVLTIIPSDTCDRLNVPSVAISKRSVSESFSQPVSPKSVSTVRQKRQRLSASVSEGFEISVNRGDNQKQSRVFLLARAASVVSSISTDSLNHLRKTLQRRCESGVAKLSAGVNKSRKNKKVTPPTALDRFRRRERSTERALFFVLFFFVLLWLPFFVTIFLLGFCPTCVNEEILTAFTWCGYASSTVNPIVYTFFNRQFKQSAKHFIHRLFRRDKTPRKTPPVPIITTNQDQKSRRKNYRRSLSIDCATIEARF